MAFCPHCGAKIERKNKFCAKCGFSQIVQKKSEVEARFERGLELLKENHPAAAIPEFEKALELKAGHEGAAKYLKDAKEALTLRQYYFCKHCASLIVPTMRLGDADVEYMPDFCPNCKHRLEINPALLSYLKLGLTQILGGITLLFISLAVLGLLWNNVWKTAYFGLTAKYALMALASYLVIFLWCAPIPYLSPSGKWQVKKYADAKDWYEAALKAFFIELGIAALIFTVFFLRGMKF